MDQGMRNMINVGTAERPVFVPIVAVSRENSPEKDLVWENIACGSISLELEDLDRLIELSNRAEGGFNIND